MAKKLERRVWRVRRIHESIEARLSPVDSRWSLQFLRNGRTMVTQRFSSPEEALSQAEARLQELRRAGWNEHW